MYRFINVPIHLYPQITIHFKVPGGTIRNPTSNFADTYIDDYEARVYLLVGQELMSWC